MPGLAPWASMGAAPPGGGQQNMFAVMFAPGQQNAGGVSNTSASEQPVAPPGVEQAPDEADMGRLQGEESAWIVDTH